MGRYVYVDEDLGEELMMPPTDIVLLEDPKFGVWVERYARDKGLFKVNGTGNPAGRGGEDYEHGRERRVSVRAQKTYCRCVGEVVRKETNWG